MSVPSQQSNLPSVPTPTPSKVNSPDQTDKPKLDVTVEEAQALLLVNNVQVGKQHKSGPSLSLVISVVILLVAVVAVTYIVGSAKPGKSSNGAGNSITKSTSQSGNTVPNSTSSQINQDVNSCSNLATAVSQC